MTWMQRLKRVFAIDIETCQRCGGALRDDPVKRDERSREAGFKALRWNGRLHDW